MTLRQKLASIIIAAATVFVSAAPAVAQYAGTTPPEVLPSETESARTPVEVKGAKQVRGVAVTGADVIGLAAIGGIAVGGGVAIRRASRRRKA